MPHHVIELCNRHGARVHLLPLGATIQRLEVPDRHGRLDDVVLGFDREEAYLTSSAYFGAVVGRYANRIRGERFSLGEQEFRLSLNDGSNCLHGGAVGFSHRIWTVDEAQGAPPQAASFMLVSADGEQGFPGELVARVTYSWSDDFCLDIEYAATTTAPTPVNLTQHSYFNLGGVMRQAAPVLDHLLTIHARHFLPVDEALVPTGTLQAVKGGPFDFNRPKRVGRDLEDGNTQIEAAGGYDHNWVLAGTGFRLVAELSHPATGRGLAIYTDQPGLQVYSGNFLGEEAPGKRNVHYPRHSGIALETQHWPDSPNQPRFPNTILRPGETFRSRTRYAFSA